MRAMRDLEQSNRELDAFARHLAHELRTSIGQVSTIAQMLLDGPSAQIDTQSRGLLRLQLQAAHRMESTLCDLLELARSGLAPLHIEAVDLGALCEALRDELCDPGTGPAHRVPAQWRIEPGMHVRACRGALAVAMRNLLSNALKYSRDARPPVISVSCRAENGWTRVRVQDNGVGFDAARAGRLFEPFARLCGEEEFEGTGLGLSIVKRVAERHGGTIEALALPQGGARFEMALPAQPQEAGRQLPSFCAAPSPVSCGLRAGSR